MNQGNRDTSYTVDERLKFKVCDANEFGKIKPSPDMIYVKYNTQISKDKQIPIWLLGFLY